MSTLNFVPVPILHSIGAHNVAFAISASIFKHNKAFVVKSFLVAVVVPSDSGDAHVKSFGAAVVAIEFASFEFADGVVVHDVVLFGYALNISEKTKPASSFLSFFALRNFT